MNDPHMEDSASRRSFSRFKGGSSQSQSQSSSTVNGFFVASQEVQSKLFQPRIPNTEKTTRTAVRAWSTVQLKDLHSLSNPIRKRPDKWIYEKIQESVFPDAKRGEELSDKSVHNLNISLAEFFEHYPKRDGSRVTPSTMLNYLEGINRWISEYVGVKINILHDAVFRANGKGYLNVADNVAAKQQSERVRTKPHNTLTDRDVSIILSHDCTSMNTPRGYINRILVFTGLFLGLRATKLRTLKWSMFHEEQDYEGKLCYRYEGIIGAQDGTCKGEKGGMSAAKTLATSIMIFDEVISFSINPYKLLKKTP